MGCGRRPKGLWPWRDERGRWFRARRRVPGKGRGLGSEDWRRASRFGLRLQYSAASPHRIVGRKRAIQESDGERRRGFFADAATVTIRDRLAKTWQTFSQLQGQTPSTNCRPAG